ncbi:S1/P1 nuclease [Scleromatobacter humisilvae]|uniref:S1/P1 nuclease n=1 Tax=Scleromatobacter humisilvae TaxID=2897159 RepID=A0A9X1YFA7_9BURK|nr:S1/P1 nuclease [Scleromatobacter humisilvae]MCK9685319.1 S1/P1 nuclease [Scleromatobacter humisilvae]
MTLRLIRAAAAFAIALLTSAAHAWGPDGHHTVGAIADRLIAGTDAEAHVRQLLGGLTLEQAAVWADCAKGVDPRKDYAYTSAGKYPECAIFETPEGEAGMIDFVRRNDTNCPREPGDESCHKEYHYTDEAIQREHYRLGDVGTREFDVVAAITATIRVLRGQPAPAPFDIKDKREALLLLDHYVGDIHQPLHVGAVYLDAQGHVVDPSPDRFDRATSTQGGNTITTNHVAASGRAENLHSRWDAVPESLRSSHVDDAWVAQARAVPPSRGPIDGWSTSWADETLARARGALRDLAFGPQANGVRSVSLDGHYDDWMTAVKKQQLTEAGARLAQALKTVWP